MIASSDIKSCSSGALSSNKNDQGVDVSVSQKESEFRRFAGFKCSGLSSLFDKFDRFIKQSDSRFLYAGLTPVDIKSRRASDFHPTSAKESNVLIKEIQLVSNKLGWGDVSVKKIWSSVCKFDGNISKAVSKSESLTVNDVLNNVFMKNWLFENVKKIKAGVQFYKLTALWAEFSYFYNLESQGKTGSKLFDWDEVENKMLTALSDSDKLRCDRKKRKPKEQYHQDNSKQSKVEKNPSERTHETGVVCEREDNLFKRKKREDIPATNSDENREEVIEPASKRERIDRVDLKRVTISFPVPAILECMDKNEIISAYEKGLDDLSAYLNIKHPFSEGFFPEINSKHDRWNSDLSSYLLYKMGVLDCSDVLDFVGKNINPYSEEYFYYVGDFISNNKEFKVSKWNQNYTLMVPKNGILDEGIDSWSNDVKQVFLLFFLGRYSYGKDCGVLKCLSVRSSIYNHALYRYMCRYLDISSIKKIDFNNPENVKKRNELARALNAREIKKPDYLFELDENNGNQRKESTDWGMCEVEAFLELCGVEVIRKLDTVMSQKSVFHKLHQSIDGCDKDYYEAFFNVCKHYQFNFQAISHTGRSGIKSNGNKRSGIPYKKEDGIKYNKESHDVISLGLTFIKKFGFKYKELYESYNAQRLYSLYFSIDYDAFQSQFVDPDDLFVLAAGQSKNFESFRKIPGKYEEQFSTSLSKLYQDCNSKKGFYEYIKKRYDELDAKLSRLPSWKVVEENPECGMDSIPSFVNNEIMIESSNGSVVNKSIARNTRNRNPLPKETLYKGCGIGDGVVVKESGRIKNCNGLFANRDFKKGEIITWFEGVAMDLDEYEHALENSIEAFTHSLQLTENLTLVGVKEPKSGIGGATFVNDFLPHNTEFVKKQLPLVVLRSTKEIKAGEEFSVAYGARYWRCFQEQFPDIKIVR